MAAISQQKGSTIHFPAEPGTSHIVSLPTVKEELFYTDTHLWLERIDENARIGVTDYVQRQPIMFVAPLMLDPKWQIDQGDPMLVIDTMVETISLQAPVDGTGLKINPLTQTEPEIIHADPYGEGWLIELSLTNPKQMDSLMNALQYKYFMRISSAYAKVRKSLVIPF